MDNYKSKPFKTTSPFPHFGIIYALISIFVLIKYFLPGIVPDFLSIQKLDAKQFFSLLLTTEGALLGILIAVLLLSFQLISKEAKRRKETSILHNQLFINFTGLSLFLLIALTISYVIIPSFANAKNLSIGYYMLYAFLSFIVFLFYIVYILLRDTDSIERVNRIIFRLKIDDFISAYNLYSNDKWENDISLKLSEIRDEIINATRDNDINALYTIITELTKKSNILIGENRDKEKCELIIHLVVIIWKDGEKSASIFERHPFIEIIFKNIESIYTYAASNKIPLTYYFFLRLYYIKLAEFLLRKSDLVNIQKYASTLTYSFMANLRNNCPPENTSLSLLRTTTTRTDFDSEIQWDALKDFISDIGALQFTAVEYKLKDIYIMLQKNLQSTADYLATRSIPSLGKLQKDDLLIDLIEFELLPNAEKAISYGMLNCRKETLEIKANTIATMLTKDSAAASRILCRIGDHLINVHKKANLNSWSTLNNFASILRIIAKDYPTNKLVRQACRYIFEVFKMLKIETEKRLPKETEMYIQIKNQLQSLKSTLEIPKTAAKASVLLSDINELLGSFKDISRIATYNIITWPQKEK